MFTISQHIFSFLVINKTGDERTFDRTEPKSKIPFTAQYYVITLIGNSIKIFIYFLIYSPFLLDHKVLLLLILIYIYIYIIKNKI
ncbi:hypothetical protein GLOIN_2v610070 [Rhizophagus irregularis DAOM 181602=DAOM 197198]|uniref:Uncharacterized protein n=1 Tax=Rhizophagus irregularis (strain DAOM 181602 / DAOM 197198 / MUCL 43194) TaxID=747089 RepID=A0A2P4PAY1_RHIID|nr:hypothetical protein GLOIN_2v610070 [Rhizophagus irregularis DAOM 181602=DAOM 197198]POG62556.1 hypothetical protein GLOIN_2v610070 [Rhizophagus irregularis DAOM 181602=DAOM 197198]GBC14853.2 hypothetical protein GLOIN_2v610070 [Rhizophagus irregularis DAOM 181602=DAOM 197198]|eukprot:XP_025169422.1 hypothetical protein GLOIN_2v610070 [Rhizophagus irregularis DAOM 181602=DAOM 197198]